MYSLGLLRPFLAPTACRSVLLCAALDYSARSGLFCAALGCSVLLGAGCAGLLLAALGCGGLLQPALGCCGLLFAALVWACFALSKPLQAILEPFWGRLGLSGPFLEPSRCHLGAIMGPLGAILAILGPSWSPPGAFLSHVKALWEPSWALLAKSTKMTPKKDSRIWPAPIDFWDYFGVILESFSGSIFEPFFKQFLDPSWDHFGHIFGSKLAPKVDHFYKAFWKPS